MTSRSIAFATKKLSTGAKGQKEDAASFSLHSFASDRAVISPVNQAEMPQRGRPRRVRGDDDGPLVRACASGRTPVSWILQLSCHG